MIGMKYLDYTVTGCAFVGDKPILVWLRGCGGEEIKMVGARIPRDLSNMITSRKESRYGRQRSEQ